jgi:hypothetical protein
MGHNDLTATIRCSEAGEDLFETNSSDAVILPRIKICGIRSRDLIVPVFAEVKEKRRQ